MVTLLFFYVFYLCRYILCVWVSTNNDMWCWRILCVMARVICSRYIYHVPKQEFDKIMCIIYHYFFSVRLLWFPEQSDILLYCALRVGQARAGCDKFVNGLSDIVSGYCRLVATHMVASSACIPQREVSLRLERVISGKYLLIFVYLPYYTQCYCSLYLPWTMVLRKWEK